MMFVEENVFKNGKFLFGTKSILHLQLVVPFGFHQSANTRMKTMGDLNGANVSEHSKRLYLLMHNDAIIWTGDQSFRFVIVG